MERRGRNADSGDFTDQFEVLGQDDAFLTDLAAGAGPEPGKDELADLFRELRGEVESQQPAPPTLASLGLPPAAAGDNVVSLDSHRRPRFGVGLISGFIGAAAATLVIAAGGAAVYNAEPGSPLWGMSKSLFGDRAAVVELAGALDEMDDYAETGDVEGLRALLNDARERLAEDRGEEPAAPRPPAAAPEARTTTATATVSAEPRATPPAAPEPRERETVVETETLVETTRETITETATQTQTRTATTTVTVVPQVPIEPAPVPVPTSVQPTPTTTPNTG